jgi:hypothetical protein
LPEEPFVNERITLEKIRTWFHRICMPDDVTAPLTPEQIGLFEKYVLGVLFDSITSKMITSEGGVLQYAAEATGTILNSVVNIPTGVDEPRAMRVMPRTNSSVYHTVSASQHALLDTADFQTETYHSSAGYACAFGYERGIIRACICKVAGTPSTDPKWAMLVLNENAGLLLKQILTVNTPSMPVRTWPENVQIFMFLTRYLIDSITHDPCPLRCRSIGNYPDTYWEGLIQTIDPRITVKEPRSDWGSLVSSIGSYVQSNMTRYQRTPLDRSVVMRFVISPTHMVWIWKLSDDEVLVGSADNNTGKIHNPPPRRFAR